MLTKLEIKNFKRFEDVSIELGSPVVFIGPNNSGKTTALQALALWSMALDKWREEKAIPEVAVRVINRQDFAAALVPEARMLWRNLQPDSMTVQVQGTSKMQTW